jgi:hypothetical protein
MKTSTPNFTSLAAAAILLAAVAPAFAQTTATTDPVGFVTKALPVGSGTTRVSGTVAFPLYRAAVYSAAATSVTDGSPNSTCQLNGANFGTGGGQTDIVTTPHLLRVKGSTNAAHVGRFLLVKAAAGDQLTFATTALSSILSVGDTCEVLPANTLGNIFGTITGTASTVPAGWVTAGNANGGDNVFVWSGTGWVTYFHDGTNWKKTGSGLNQNLTIVYPDEGIFVARIGSTPISLVSVGGIPTTTERSDLDGLASTFLSNRFPTDTQLGSLGLQSLPGWVSGANSASADNVFIYNNGWQTYFYNGSAWRKTGSGVDQGTTPIPAGSAIFVYRTTAGTATLTQTTPYTP